MLSWTFYTNRKPIVTPFVFVSFFFWRDGDREGDTLLSFRKMRNSEWEKPYCIFMIILQLVNALITVLEVMYMWQMKGLKF